MSEAAFVTTQKWPGRLGDQLFLVTKGEWVAHRFGYSFYRREFDDAKAFCLSEPVLALQRSVEPRPLKVRGPNDVRKVRAQTLCEVSYFYAENDWSDPLECCTWTTLLHDRSFREKLKKKLSFKASYSTLPLPEGYFSVALHLRRGNGSDPPLKQNGERSPSKMYGDELWPLKFPPLSYYASQLLQLQKELEGTPLFIVVFSDAKEPERDVEQLLSLVASPGIFWQIKLGGTPLEDLYQMSHSGFQGLIRSQSNFSQMAQLAGSFTHIGYPTSASTCKGDLLVEGEIYHEYTQDP